MQVLLIGTVVGILIWIARLLLRRRAEGIDSAPAAGVAASADAKSESTGSGLFPSRRKWVVLWIGAAVIACFAFLVGAPAILPVYQAYPPFLIGLRLSRLLFFGDAKGNGRRVYVRAKEFQRVRRGGLH